MTTDEHNATNLSQDLGILKSRTGVIHAGSVLVRSDFNRREQMTDNEINQARDRNLSLVGGAIPARPEPTVCPGLALLQRGRAAWKRQSDARQLFDSPDGQREAKRMFHALDYYCDVARWAAAGGQGEAPRLELTGTLFSDGKMPREAVEIAVEAARLVSESK